MIDTNDDPEYLSRSTDHVANLASQLADLVGYATLACELVQNADDAKAELMTFSVLADRLEVWNDKTFTDCGRQDLDVCPWLAGEPEAACDFHSFRLVASGNKAHRADTTGKFGIGFTSVYQITDHPEIISAGRHWILDEMAEERRRIRICSGDCSQNHADTGTLFILPYATERSALRQALKVKPFTREDSGHLGSELFQVIPDALLFLRNTKVIEIDHGNCSSTFERTVHLEGRVDIDYDGSKMSWRFIETDFADSADEIRGRYTDLIEKDRGSRVRVAISDAMLDSGLLYAGLPTRTILPHFPVRIDAEFFPTRDRKSVHLEDDHRGAWNKAALRAAASAIAEQIEVIFGVIKAEATWRLILAAHRLSQEAEREESDLVFGEFWGELVSRLPAAEIVPVQGGRDRASAGLLLAPVGETQASVLDALGVDVASDQVRAVLSQLPMSELGVRWLTLADVIQACEVVGLTESWTPDQPGGRLTRSDLGRLLEVVQALVASRRLGQLDGLESVAVIPCESGRVCAPTDVCRLDDDESRHLLASLDLPIEIVDEARLGEKCPFLLSRCADFSPEVAIGLLSQLDQIEPASAIQVLHWLNGRRSRIPLLLMASIASLPMFPSATGLRPLSDLALPGGFEDPLGLATVVDLSRIGRLRDFLTYLGARPLDLPTYITKYAAPHIRAGRLDRDQADKLVGIIATHKSELEEVPGLLATLQALPMIRCADGKFRSSLQIYFPDADVAGWDVHRVASLDGGLGPALTHAFEWLGVAREGRREDIIAQVKMLSRVDVSVDLTAVADFILALSRHSNVLEWLKAGALNPLKLERWLPDKSGGRFRPESIYPTFQEHLFSTQGPFLGISQRVQAEARELLYAVKVPRDVPVQLVIRHLRECAQRSLPINSAIYRYLADRERDWQLTPAHLAELREMAFIQTAPGEYRQPDEVFWDESPFGPYSVRLAESLRSYTAFFGKVGVKDAPDYRDAIRVLKRMAVDWRGVSLEDEQRAVVHACWALIQRQLSAGATDQPEIADELSAVHCVPDGRLILERPETLFFPDPAGIGARSALLTYSLVERHLDTWIAYQAAGVRNISNIIQTTVQLDEPVSRDHSLAHIVAERATVLRRVLEAQDSVDASAAYERLLTIQFIAAVSIHVQHELRALGQVDCLEPIQTHCYYELDKHRLIRATTTQVGGWDAVAPELARALAPDLESHILAGDLLHVLTAPDAASADRLLTVLGIPLLSNAPPPIVTQLETGTLGAQDSDEQPAPYEPPQEQSPTGQADQHLAELLNSGSAMDLLDSEKDTTGAEPSETGQGPEAEPADSGARSAGSADHGQASGRPHQSAGGQATGSPRSREPGSRQERMISYVLHGESEDEQIRRDDSADRSDVDKEGIRAAKEYEQQHGRTPREMPHNYPGFDIVSEDEHGTTLRRIEVKSTEGPWGERGVVLSRRQFTENWNEGPLYWLYVVEYATSPEKQKIYPIPDPVAKVTAFVFDNGWAGVAQEAR
jgi:hypothetical protein